MADLAKINKVGGDMPIRRYTSPQLRSSNQLGYINAHTTEKLKKFYILRAQNTRFDICRDGIPKIPPPPRHNRKTRDKTLNKDQTTINAGLINARSAIKNASAIHDIIFEHNLDLLAITETWFSASSPPRLDELVPGGFKILTQDRQENWGCGGTLIYKEYL